MSQSNRRKTGIGHCIYCGSKHKLSKERVIPYGLGGDLVLNDASCEECSRKTGRMEQQLLRGHWWPYRLRYNLPSRKKEKIPDLKILIKKDDGSEISGYLPMENQTVAVEFEFEPPSILFGKIRQDTPSSPRVFMKLLGQQPIRYQIDGMDIPLNTTDKMDIPINFDAGVLCQFLAKIAHGYAISRRGIGACKEYFLPPIILGAIEANDQ